jgi:hypothetical protein
MRMLAACQAQVRAPRGAPCGVWLVGRSLGRESESAGGRMDPLRSRAWAWRARPEIGARATQRPTARDQRRRALLHRHEGGQRAAVGRFVCRHRGALKIGRAVPIRSEIGGTKARRAAAPWVPRAFVHMQGARSGTKSEARRSPIKRRTSEGLSQAGAPRSRRSGAGEAKSSEKRTERIEVEENRDRCSPQRSAERLRLEQRACQFGRRGALVGPLVNCSGALPWQRLRAQRS